MDTYFAYIRVSTAKQGERGVSLDEQKSAILGYSTRNKLHISQWFEERETAAKRGRPIFSQMLRLLRRKQAKGIIIHKIDRSARNLKDWVDLGELTDQGCEIHFVNESLDMASRGGRLSADIQAVVAADYIRNLREEARKGFYGRLKQGFYPLPAPVGYIDKGGGKLKVPDPIKSRQVRKLFELHGTGEYSIVALTEEANRIGLRSRKGGRMVWTSVHHILTNPFYIGLVRIKTTNELFEGGHQPIITKSVFDATQAILSGKYTRPRVQKNGFIFRQLLTCKLCNSSMTGERQKGHVYYRCHTKECPTKTVREEAVEAEFLELLKPLEFTKEEQAFLDTRVAACKEDWKDDQANRLAQHRMDLAKAKEKRIKLTDFYLEDSLDKASFEMRRNELLLEIKGLEEKILLIETGKDEIVAELEKFFELCKTANSQYEYGLLEEKREIIKITTSNRFVCQKKLDFSLSFPFQQVAERQKSPHGGPFLRIVRTCDVLVNFFRKSKNH